MRLVGWVLRGTVYLALAGVVVFFALTRTEVGRDGIRQQLQVEFNERFAGSLHIGSLQGTLLNELRATNVRLRDADGQLVARIDSVVTEPHWRHLLTAELSVGSITLFRPQLTLHRHADSTWNLQRALTPRSSSTTDRALDLSLSDIQIRDGRISTTRSGAPPAAVANRWLFDYTRADLDRLNVDASLTWSDSRRSVHLQSLTFRLPEQDLTVHSARFSAVRTGLRWEVSPASLRLGNTELSAQATIQPSPRDRDHRVIDLQLAESRLDHDQLRRLLPRLPVRETVTVEGRLGGSFGRFVLNELTVEHGRSSITMEGTAFGLPDSLDVDAQLTDSRVRLSDLRAVWPNVPLDRAAAFDLTQLEAAVQGVVDWREGRRPRLDLEGTLAAQGAPGAVRGSLSVRRDPPSRLAYEARLAVDSLNLAPLTGSPHLDSRLTGTITAEGRGTRLSTQQSTVTATFEEARVGPRRLARMTLRLSSEAGRTKGSLVARQPSGGEINMRGTVALGETVPEYTLRASVQTLNLAGLHPPLPSSEINGRVRADGRGNSWRRLVGTANVEIDSSHLRSDSARTALPSHEATLSLAEPGSSMPRVHLTGTIASGSIDGPLLGPGVLETGGTWMTALQEAVRGEMRRASRLAPDSTTSPRPRETPPPTAASLTDSVAVAQPGPPFQLEGALTIHRMDLLRKWWPGAPDEGNGLRATTQLHLAPDTLSASGTVTVPRLRLGHRALDSLEASYQLSGPFQSNLLDNLTLDLAAQADTFRFGGRSLVQPVGSLSLRNRIGTARGRADKLGRTGPFRFAGQVHVTDGVHLRVSELFLGTDQNDWRIQERATVSVFRDALVVDSLTLTSPRPLTEGTQYFRVAGTLSSAASDTLRARMSNVLLHPVGELASFPRSLGGELNGSVALTGGLSQPQVRSAFAVRRLTFDRRVLGNLQVRTRLTAGGPDLLVDASLTPGPPSISEVEGPPLVPDGPRAVEENQLEVEGRVRLPGWPRPDTGTASSDQLDLTVDVQRADLFFFKYIFEETLATVRGYTEGTIHVGGRFLRPIFDASLRIRNGRFTLPQFGLAYSASGPVDVDRYGIHLQGLSVRDDEGAATVQGSVLFNEYRYFSFDLSAELDELTIVDVNDAEELAFYGDIRASGPVSLTGPLQDATLRSESARTTPESELYIPVSEGGVENNTGFIVFADSTGQIPDLRDLTHRDNILSDRPEGEPSFLEGLEIDINVLAPEESTVNLVFDPVVGDVVTAVGSGRVQLQRQEGEFFVYGTFNVSGGNYLFTAGEVFVRRFAINSGTISWDGPPINARLDLEAEYRTRASPAGLPGYDGDEGRIPVRVLLDIGGRVETPLVDLSLARVRDERNDLVGSRTLDAILNQADRTTEYATSVLLTNTFLLTTESFTEGRAGGSDNSAGGSLASAGRPLAFNSVSQLVASQLNRYLGAALPNVDLNFGLQGENPSDLDLIYGVALRLLNERLIIRGEGVYTGDDPGNRQAEGPQGEFVVEVRLSNRVSLEAFYRRTGDELTRGQTLTSSTGAGVSYQTEFSSWRQLFGRVFGWLIPGLQPPSPPPSPQTPDEEETSPQDPVARRPPSETSNAPAPSSPNE